MKNWAIYHECTPDVIENIMKDFPVAYLPWGAIEYHSYHNPIGLDGMKAYKLCCDLANQCGGLVLPPVYQAANLIKSYPGVHFKEHSLEFSEELIRMTCQEYFQQLVEAKFKVIICLSGHAGQPHLNILKDVNQIFTDKFPFLRFWTLAEFDILPDNLLTANHSALGETSLQLHYYPDSVKMDALPKDRIISLERDGISGKDPRDSSPGWGKWIVDNFIDKAVPIVNKMIADIQ